MHWGTEPWQWFICQYTTLTAKSAREQVRNKRVEGKYLGLKLFWKFLIKKINYHQKKKSCVVAKATYTGLQQGAKSFIFKTVITGKNRSALSFSPLENHKQIELLIWFHNFQENTSIICPISLWYQFSSSFQGSLLRQILSHEFKTATQKTKTRPNKKQPQTNKTPTPSTKSNWKITLENSREKLGPLQTKAQLLWNI